MGEIIFSIAIGFCLVLSGIVMLIVLRKEENIILKERKDQKDGE